MFSFYQRFELINFDGCCWIATSAMFILLWKVSTTRDLWLDVLLWPIIFSLVLYFTFCLVLNKKRFASKTYENTLRHLNLARNAWWDFCPLVETITRFFRGFGLNLPKYFAPYFGHATQIALKWIPLIQCYVAPLIPELNSTLVRTKLNQSCASAVLSRT